MFTTYTGMWVAYVHFLFSHLCIRQDNFCRQLSYLTNSRQSESLRHSGQQDKTNWSINSLLFGELFFLIKMTSFALKLAPVKVQEEPSLNYYWCYNKSQNQEKTKNIWHNCFGLFYMLVLKYYHWLKCLYHNWKNAIGDSKEIDTVTS